jgi:hypothetical protein
VNNITSNPVDSSDFSEVPSGQTIVGTSPATGGSWILAGSPLGTGTFFGCTAPDGTPAVYKPAGVSTGAILDSQVPLGFDIKSSIDIYCATSLNQEVGLIMSCDGTTNNCVLGRWQNDLSRISLDRFVSGSSANLSTAAVSAPTPGTWYNLTGTWTGGDVPTLTLTLGKGGSGSVIATCTHAGISSNTWVPGYAGICNTFPQLDS